MERAGQALSPVRTPASRLKALCQIAISFYRTCISPVLGPHCRFFPSCSEYASDAIREHGLHRGIIKAIFRLSRCHPFSAGGYDPAHR